MIKFAQFVVYAFVGGWIGIGLTYYSVKFFVAGVGRAHKPMEKLRLIATSVGLFLFGGWIVWAFFFSSAVAIRQ